LERPHWDAEGSKKMAVIHAFGELQRKAKARAIKDEHVHN
jgi:hypothetical protein